MTRLLNSKNHNWRAICLKEINNKKQGKDMTVKRKNASDG
jgi:hypothetical protein